MIKNLRENLMQSIPDAWSNINFLDKFYLTYPVRVAVRLRYLSKYIKNWYALPLLRLGLHDIDLKFRNGRVVKIADFNEWRKVGGTLLQDYMKDIIRNVTVERYGMALEDLGFYEVFVDEPYRDLNVKDRVVVDIGAFIGDSAIYFALRGARHVYAYEPYPSHYELAVRYIEQLNLEDKITIYNRGVGCENSVITLSPNGVNPARGLKQTDSGVMIKIVTLRDIVSSINHPGEMVLKIDCEGCEYSLIECGDDALERFEQIILEYHYGYRNLSRKLSSLGFKVKHKRPRYSYNPHVSNPHMIVGLLYAYRVS